MNTNITSKLLFPLLLLVTIGRAQTGNVTNAIVNVSPGTVVITGGGIILQDSAAIDNGGDIRLEGDWTNNARGLINSTPGVVKLDGMSSQIIGGNTPTDFYNLTINNPAGVTLSNNENVESALTFNNGKVSTGADTLTLTANPPIPINGANTSSYVDGNLRVAFPAGNTTMKYEIGSSVYAPATLDLRSVATPGKITGTTFSGPEPNENNPILNASGIDQTKKADQYWVMSNSGATFADYDITFDFTNTTNTGNTANYIVSKFDAPSTWSATTSSVTGTTITATGLTSFSEFEVGEPVITMVAGSEASNGAMVFPNPVHNKVTLQIKSASSAEYIIKLIDMTGRMLLTKTVQAEKGNNLFDFNLGEYAAGLYTICLEDGRWVQNLVVAVE